MSDAAVADPFEQAFAEVPPPTLRDTAGAPALPELSADDIAAARAHAAAAAKAEAPPPPVNVIPGEESAAPGAPPASPAPVIAAELPEAAQHPDGHGLPGWREALIAWHHRGRLARRLQLDQLAGMGLVRLAFKAAVDPALPLQPLFKPEKLVPGLPAKALAAFVQANGFDHAPGPAEWPVRELGPSEVTPPEEVQWRYLITATYPGLFKAPARALVGRGADGQWQLRGRRGLAPQRLAAVAGALLGVLALAGAALWWWRATPAAAAAHAPATAASAAAPTASAAVAGAAASSAPRAEPQPQAEAPEAAASAPAAVPRSASAEAVESAEVAETTHDSKIGAAHPEPAAAEAAVAEAPAPKPVVVPALPGVKPRRPLHAPPETAVEPATRAEPSVRFALVSGVYADPAPLVAQRRRLRQALGREGEHLRLELMPAPGGQVLTLWPLAQRADAEALAKTLREAGIAMRAMPF